MSVQKVEEGRLWGLSSAEESATSIKPLDEWMDDQELGPSNMMDQGHDELESQEGLSLESSYNLMMNSLVEANTQPSVSRSSEFLDIATIMEKLGTNYFKGGRSTFAANSWLQSLEKNFSVTECPKEYKKDIAVYHLKKDAANWWTNLEKQYRDKEPTWEDFRREFKTKYFPQEVREKLEAKFLKLEQAERSVRKYEAEFSRLQRYTSYGDEDKAATIRRFMRGLRPEIRSRLQAVVFSSLPELVERTVNVEESVAAENDALSQNYGGSSSRLKGGQSRIQKKEKNKKGCRKSRMKNIKVGCYLCGQFGHSYCACPSMR
ncbi:PREDICTED: uncharacterized protein LOC104773148 [Camelina sativa]|uniref:Uncharacterized protein LOC104773148 n=1 Tax=Camelina sativa TaxID=90675 RepID=A0ABM0Y5W7_CAMSA|nr:PREDICTED: uncharacterized protein LOC104773148 [Camelina sativa]